MLAAGDRITAAKLNYKAYARYERQTGSQTIPFSADTQLQFPTAVKTHADVVASGTNNTGWTLSAGLWVVTWGIRPSAVDPTWETTVAADSLTWAVGNVIAAGAVSGLNGGGSVLVQVDDGTTRAVTFGVWQASGSNKAINTFGHGVHCEFGRVAFN